MRMHSYIGLGWFSKKKSKLRNEKEKGKMKVPKFWGSVIVLAAIAVVCILSLLMVSPK